MNIIEYIIANIQAFGVGVVAIFLLWDKFFSGSLKIRKEIANDYKERNTQLEGKITELSSKLDATNISLAKMEATLVEKDKHIASLTEILQGKNPEITDLLGEIKKSNMAILNFMQDSKKELKMQTIILKKQQSRAKEIDKASFKHKGPVMRSPIEKKNKELKLA